MSARKKVGVVLLAIALVAVTAGVVAVVRSQVRTDEQQAALDPFYATPDPLTAAVGTVVRSEPLDIVVPGGRAERIVYVSERADGTPAVSGGMVFIPSGPAVAGGRPVVAWEHGTLGMGNACVPSRSANPTADMTTWLGPMMDQGWVVVATDYVGLGTQGPNQYLVSQSEVRDVVNAVRAVRTMPEAQAGSRYVTFGHSQGGHSAIWTGHLGQQYAPELELLGVAAAAPALDLPAIASAQWDQAVGWVIGSDLIESWPTVYSDLPVDAILTTAGADVNARLSAECIGTSGLEALALEKAGQQMFSQDPATQPQWRAALEEQAPDPLPASMPVFIAQGTADQVVLPWPTAIVERDWCAAGSTIDVLWLGGVNHQQAALVGGPAAVGWIADRFAGLPAPRSCDAPTIVAPEPPASTG